MSRKSNMSGKLVVTRRNEQIVTALYENNQLCELQFDSEKMIRGAHTAIVLGNIYVAKVQNIVKNINGAFLEIGKEQLCYYSLTDNKKPIVLNATNRNFIAVGDLLLVQIQKEAMKTKLPGATSYLNLTGKYLVLTVGKCSIGISNKIQSLEERNRLKTWMSKKISKEYGWIVRTNAEFVSEEKLEQEATLLIKKYESLMSVAKYRTSGQLLYEAPVPYLTALRDQKEESIARIVTDDTVLYTNLKQYLEEYQPEDSHKLELYEDSMISLSNLLGLEKEIEEAIREKVWMKSGGYLIIQPTEAMTVIDVNTGKAMNKKRVQDHFLQINLEAAKEIARQIRLRNLSGIIIVDFIDLDTDEAKETLLATLRKFVAKDRIKTDVIDMTKLNLVEITRKKILKPIYEQMKERG